MEDDIVFLRADSKSTLIARRGDDGRPAEALVRTPLRELAVRLDPSQLKGRPEVLSVSRNHLHLFRQR